MDKKKKDRSDDPSSPVAAPDDTSDTAAPDDTPDGEN